MHWTRKVWRTSARCSFPRNDGRTGSQRQPSLFVKSVSLFIEFAGKIEHEMNYVFEYTTDDNLDIKREAVEQMRKLSVNDCKRFFEFNANDITLDNLKAYDQFAKLKRLI